MLISEKISAKKNSKRERIIQAASELFSEKNFHEVMMTDVAQRASIAKGTLYNYYNSKEDLYFSVMLIRMENLISSLKNKIQAESTALASLHTFIIHNYMFLMKYQCFFRMYQKENLNASNLICEELRNKNNELREILFNILCEGINRHYFRNVDQDLISDLVLGVIFAAVNKGIKDNHNSDIQAKEREKIFNFVINGLLNGRELKQRRILITRAEDEAEDFTSELTGMDIVYFPTIEIVPVPDNNIFIQLAADLQDCNYLILTSANAVKILSEKFRENNIDPDYSNIIVAAVGKKTALECEKYHLPVRIIPDKYCADDLIDVFKNSDLDGKKILIPGSSLSNDKLPEYLTDAGAEVRQISIYDVHIPDKQKHIGIIEQLKKNKPSLFVFTSPSSFRNFISMTEVENTVSYFKDTVIAAIGNTTKSEIEKLGLTVHLLPEENTLSGLGRAVRNYINQNIPQENQ